MRDRTGGYVFTLPLAAFGHIAFFADSWRRVMPVWTAVALTMAPLLLALVGAGLDAEAGSARWRAAGRAMELTGGALALLFDAMLLAMLVAGLAPRGWPLYAALAAVGVPVSVAIVRDYALGPSDAPSAARGVYDAPARPAWFSPFLMLSSAFVVAGLVVLLRGAPPARRLMLVASVAFFALSASVALWPPVGVGAVRVVERWSAGLRRARAWHAVMSGAYVVVAVGLLVRAAVDPYAPGGARRYAVAVAVFYLLAALVARTPPHAREPRVRSFHVAFEGLLARHAHGVTLFPWDALVSAAPAEMGPFPLVRVALTGDAEAVGRTTFRAGASAAQRARWTKRRARAAFVLPAAVTIGEGQCGEAALREVLETLRQGLADPSWRTTLPTVAEFQRRFFGGGRGSAGGGRTRRPYRD